MHHTDGNNAMVHTKTSEFDIELCHAFFSAVCESDIICKPCKQGLIQRYLHSKEQDNLVFKVYRRINNTDYPLLLRLVHTLGGPQDFQRAIRDLDDIPCHSQPSEAAGPKQWDCVHNETWGNLCVWLRSLAKEESVISHPLTRKEIKSSAWRSRMWAAAAGRYSLEDLRNGRSMWRFLNDHEGRLLEASLWPAEAKIPRLAKYEITPAACECFPLGDGTVKFQDIIQKLSVFPEILRDPGYIRLRRQAIVARLVQDCFAAEIVQAVFQRYARPPVPENADPFAAFMDYWDSAVVRRAIRRLLKLPQDISEAVPDQSATERPEHVAESDKKLASRPFYARRGVTFKHPSVEVECQTYHPLTSLHTHQGPIDYEGEARNIRMNE